MPARQYTREPLQGGSLVARGIEAPQGRRLPGSYSQDNMTSQVAWSAGLTSRRIETGRRETTPGGAMKKLIRITAIAALAALTSPSSTHAQVYPSRPITMNVPYAAGGPLDVMVRVVAEGRRGALGRAIVIENVAGARGSLGLLPAARAAPRGYTVSAGNLSTHLGH